MIRLICKLVYLLMILSVSIPVYALGTRAGTPIINNVTVDYNLAGIPATATASVATVVDELLDVNVSWLDAAPVNVMSPSVAQVLTFRVSNTGNGVESFILSVQTPNTTPQFNPTNIRLWEDTNGNGVLNAVGDTQIPLSGTISLDGAVTGGNSIVVFVVADISNGLSAGDLGNVQLVAVSQTASVNGKAGVVGSVLTNSGDGGLIDALVGTTGAQHGALGSYRVVTNVVNIVKSVVVSDHRGGNQPYPGAVLKYTLQININGIIPVNHLVIRDIVPANTRYDSAVDSIRLDNVLQTNANDAPVDYGWFDSSDRSINVDLSQGGAVSINPPAQFTVTFDVMID